VNDHHVHKTCFGVGEPYYIRWYMIHQVPFSVREVLDHDISSPLSMIE
jgi:hypothetical protein